MELTEVNIEKVKKRIESQYDREFTDAEVREAIERHNRICETLDKAEQRHQSLLARLKDEPKGFHITDGIYECCICDKHITGDETWFDQNGTKCVSCQRAVDNQTVPSAVCHDRDSWYSLQELQNHYDVSPLTLRKLIRLGKLKSRVIPDDTGKPYFHVFLIAENLPVLSQKPAIIGIQLTPTRAVYQKPIPRELVVSGVAIPRKRYVNRRKAVPVPQNWVCFAIINKNLCETPIRDQNDIVWSWSGCSDSDSPEKPETVKM